ncbi:MAG: hypothetical protein U0869_06795 [Chloroflexota bacterium]
MGAATLDWKIRTDPDGDPDPLLDLRGITALPDFSLSVADPTDELARGGVTFLDVTLARTGGHTGRILVTVPDLPDGVTADVAPSPARKSAVRVTLRAGASAAAGPFQVTIRASDGDLVRTTTADIQRRAGGPTVDFRHPAADPALTGADTVTVAFTEDDPGSPPDARQVLRQSGTPVTPGSCDGVDWSADGPAVAPGALDPGGSAASGWSFEAPLSEDGCTRWLVRLVDAEGGSARFASLAVLRDTADPLAPVVKATGEGVFQAGADVWVRAGSGTVSLIATGRDAGSGVVSHRFGAPSDPTGWTGDGVTEAGDPSAVDLAWGPAAATATLEVTAKDALDRVGPARTITLRPDASAPRVAGWVYPRSGSFERSGFVPELMWKPVADRGSGPAVLQQIQRQVAKPAHGTCRRVDWRADGPARLAAQHDEQWDLVSARCYRWILTPLDNAGNAGAPVTSGILLVDLLAPTADFLQPDEGTETVVRPGAFRVRWTEREQPHRGPVYRWLERERVRIQDGSCPTLGWIHSGPTDRGSSPSTQRLEAGFCYRWRLNLADVRFNLGVALSGVVRVQKP